MPSKRKTVQQKFGGRCAYCGYKLFLTIDHIIPRKNFDTLITQPAHVPHFLRHLQPGQCGHIDNLFPACTNCNTIKGNSTLEQFRYTLVHLTHNLRNHHHYNTAMRFGFVIEAPKQKLS